MDNLKETVANIVREEFAEWMASMRFTGPYEGEEFNVIVTLRSEPRDLDERDERLYHRISDLGYDIGYFVELPEEAVAA